MRRIAVDLEATCWEDEPYSPDMETIEIGAVDLRTGETFETLVRPVIRPDLSPFCVELTHITQAMVDAAPPFREALAAFVEWSGLDFAWYSWGDYDLTQLTRDVLRYHPQVHHRVAWSLGRHRNAKRMYERLTGNRARGLGRTARRYGITFEGDQHRALPDALVVAKLINETLRRRRPAAVCR